MRTLPRFLAAPTLLLLAPIFAFGQLTPDQKVADFLHIADTYDTQYGPYEWKKQVQNFDMLDLKPWIEKIRRTTTDTEYAELLVDYVASLNDAHDSIAFPFYFYGSLGFSVDIYDGKVLFESINRLRLPSSRYPFVAGDELVSMDGKPVSEWIAQLRKYAIAANPVSTDRLAASYLSYRDQSYMPSMTSLEDSSVIEVRRASTGALETYTVEWTKYGTPSTTFGKMVLPGPRTGVASATQGAAVFNPSGYDDSLPEYMAPVQMFLHARVGHEKYAILGWGSRSPVFAPPAGFEQRLGRLSSDFFYSGTFPADGLKIGFIRIPNFSPPSAAQAYQQFETEMRYFQANTDGLIIDDTRNPGGSVSFVEGLAQRVIPYTFRVLGFEVRATPGWIYNWEYSVDLAEAFGYEPWIVDSLKAQLAQLKQANSEVRGRTGPIAINSYGGLEIPPSPIAYTKPIMVLVDELSASGGDAFPAILQDNGRALLFGNRTMGAGGNVVDYTSGTFSEAAFTVTQSLMNRKTDIVTADYPAAPYVENIGVRPDVVVDYMTRENLMNSGRPYVQAFTQTMVNYIRTGKP